jgi:hypothetical protein
VDNANSTRTQLLALLRGGNSHDGYAEALATFPPDLINTLVPNTSYTPYRLLEHLRIAQWDIVEFVRNPRHVSPRWPEGHWPPPGHTATPAEWEQSLAAFWKDLHDFQALVADPATELFADLPHAPGYTVLREVLVLADHNAYHLGEMALLRHVIGASTQSAQ